MLYIVIVTVAVLIILGLAFIFNKKCITYSDEFGNKNGGCFYIWQKGYWSGEGLFNVTESEAINKICSDNLASDMAMVTIYKSDDGSRIVFKLHPDSTVIKDGPDIYFDGQGKEVFSTPSFPVTPANQSIVEELNNKISLFLEGLQEDDRTFCKDIKQS